MLAALVFISLAFVICLPLSAYAALFASASSGAHSQPVPTSDPDTHDNHTHHYHEKRRNRGSAVAMWAVVATHVLIISLAISAVATFLAQFYGIMGFIQSLVDNGLFASYVNGGPQLQGDVVHGPWTQGKGLSTFTSLGWFFGAVGAGAVGAVWPASLRASR